MNALDAGRKHIAVLGGGISGLTSAYRLAQSGCRVTLLEASSELGGLGGTFEHEGSVMERFYHVMLNSDDHLLGLLDELKLSSRVEWRETKMGFLYGGRMYPFNTPVDLLRFGGLSIGGRLRTAMGAAYTAKLLRDPAGLDETPVSDWLRGIYGAQVFERLWKPLLRAKFGDLYEKVPAYWFWSRLRREKSGAKEVKGYMSGGYREIAGQLRAAIERMGGVVRTGTPAEALRETLNGPEVMTGAGWESFNAVVSTLPLPQLAGIARGWLQPLVPHRDLLHQGVVNVVALCRKSVMPYYWAAVVKDGFPFQGVVETTHVVPPSQTGGRHLVYFLNYCSRDSQLYNTPDAELKRQASEALEQIHPGYSPGMVETMKVFRAPYVEPVWPLGYLSRKPEFRLGDSRVYISTTAHAYPQVNSWNTMVGVAIQASAQLLHDLRRTERRPLERAA